MAIDVSGLTDEELEEHLRGVIRDRDNRASLRNTPGQIAGLLATYVELGGDPDELVPLAREILNEPEPEPEPEPLEDVEPGVEPVE